MDSKELAGGQVSVDGQRHLAGKYLTFSLQNELYGVEILKVQEIMGMLPITRVPQSPIYLKGVINLRGKVIPVVDLRLKLDMPEEVYNEKTCIIVVNIKVKGQDIMVGVVVDSVREVYDFSQEQIEPAPRFGVDMDTTVILGMGKIDDTVVTLLDINRAIGEADLSTAQAAEQVSAAAE